MEIQCAHCHKIIDVKDDTAEGSRVRCPFCDGKFEYLKTSTIVCAACRKEIEIPSGTLPGARVKCPFCDEKFTYEERSEAAAVPVDTQGGIKSEITDADLRNAILQCRKDPANNRYYSNAPAGARLYIGLLFYGMVYKTVIDAGRYLAAFAEIEPELNAEDIRYLLRFEDDAQMREYLENLLLFMPGTDSHRHGVASSPKIGIIRPRPVSSETDSIGMTDREPEKKTVAENAIRRKLETINKSEDHAVDLNAEAIKRRIEADDSERAEIEAKNAAIALKTRKNELIRLVVSIVVVLVVLLSGFLWVNSMNKARSAREAEMAKERQRLENIDKERREAEEKERLEEQARKEELRETEERERRAAAERIELERRKAKEAREAAEKALEEKRAAIMAEREALAEAKRQAAETYRKVFAGLSGIRLRPWSSLPAKNRPGAVDGVFYCLMKRSGRDVELHEVSSSTNGAFTVKTIEYSGETVQLDPKQYTDSIESCGGLVVFGKNVYFLAPSKNRNGWPLPSSGFNPSDMCLDGCYSLARRYGILTDSVVFEVSVDFGGEDKSRREDFGNVDFDDTIEHRDVMERIETRVRRRVSLSMKKPPRQTVMMYDGRIIKRQADGVVFVPRRPERYDRKWRDYEAEARRQELLVRKYEREMLDNLNEAIRRGIEDEARDAKVFIRMKNRGSAENR